MLEEDLTPAPKRFKFSDESQMRQLAEGLQPKATTNATKWTLKSFEQWSQCSEQDCEEFLVDVKPFLQLYLQQMFLCYQNTYHSL